MHLNDVDTDTKSPQPYQLSLITPALSPQPYHLSLITSALSPQPYHLSLIAPTLSPNFHAKSSKFRQNCPFFAPELFVRTCPCSGRQNGVWERSSAGLATEFARTQQEHGPGSRQEEHRSHEPGARQRTQTQEMDLGEMRKNTFFLAGEKNRWFSYIGRVLCRPQQDVWFR